MVEPHASFHLTLLRGAAGECIPRPSLALRHSCPDSTWRAGGDPSGRSSPYGRPNALAMAPNHDGVYVASNGCSNGAGALESRPSLDETPPDGLDPYLMSLDRLMDIDFVLRTRSGERHPYLMSPFAFGWIGFFSSCDMVVIVYIWSPLNSCAFRGSRVHTVKLQPQRRTPIVKRSRASCLKRLSM
ncbi:hypothetical protein BHE74_00014040 [Ensete ventricosum]|nr:hypothetical protein GW17_00000357 [Ensete ventricosum]RWW77779.1 hypothetical protein BHE74_00014040 [Ensete ventricosum]RZR90152.1 hypothetical protein BHM03_00017986 [Ensete ventricosum]